MRMQLFEILGEQTTVRLDRTYQTDAGLMVTFSTATNSQFASRDFGFDLYDLDDHIFESGRQFPSLEDARNAALVAAALHQRKAA